MKTFQLTLVIFLQFIGVSMASAQDKAKPEPEFLGYYFTHSDGSKVDKVSSSEKFIYLFIETKNAEGETIVFNTDDEDLDYIYKNKFLSANSSIRIKVKSDLVKIKLFVFKANNKKHQRIKEK